MGRKGRGAAKGCGKHPWEQPGGAAAATTTAPITRTPRGRKSDRDNKTHPWGDDGAIAALEFSLPLLGRRGTGTWRPGGGGLSQAAGDRGWGAAPGPLGHQSPHPGLGGQLGAASAGRGTAREPPGGETRGWHHARSPPHQRGNRVSRGHHRLPTATSSVAASSGEREGVSRQPDSEGTNRWPLDRDLGGDEEV